MVLTRSSPGRLERLVMGSNRDRLLRRLRRHDRYGRLRVYHPVTPGPDGERGIKVHSKLIIVDEELLKVGSSNLNNRSMGLDSECDVAIEACNDATRRAIARVRDELLAEHLGAETEAVANAVAREGSLIRAIEKLNVNPRGLRMLGAMWRDGATSPLPLTWLLDPARPIKLGAILTRWWDSLRAKL